MNKKITTTSAILSIISLLADIAALSQLAYSIVVQKQTGNFVLQILIISLVFLLGLGLGNVGLRGTEKIYLEKILEFYTWGYLIVACLSYLGVIVQLRGTYSTGDYFSFLLILAIQLSAFTIMLYVTKIESFVSYAIAVMTMAVLHALVFLYYFIFMNMPRFGTAIGELFIWFCWTLFAAFLILKSSNAYGRKNRFKR
jgi:hypothetical protein